MGQQSLSAAVFLDLSKDETTFSAEERKMFRRMAMERGGREIEMGQEEPKSKKRRRRSR